MSDSERPEHAGEAAGILYGGLAYAVWGIIPAYWRLLGDVPPFEITMHRILWCSIFVVGVTAWRGRFALIVTILRTPRLLRMLALTSLLISSNWTMFIYCVATNRLVEASLGYYLTPLLSIALGVFLFGETMSRMRVVGVVLATIAVIVQMVAVGHVPWLGLALALTFGFYGFFRKQAPVDALDGLMVETLLVLPIAAALIGYWAYARQGAFPSPNFAKDCLLIGAGPVTAVPLALFAAGARRMRMSTLGFVQYLSPSITLILATLVYREPFTRADGVSFVLVWAALVIVAVDGRVGQPAPESG